MVWDSIIAGYLFLAGLGAGAFILGALSSWSGKRSGVKPAKLKLAAFIIGPVAVAVGTLLLIVDAKAGAANPLRLFFLVSNLQSVMSWGVIILCLFLLVSVIDLVLLIVKKSTPAILDGIGLVLAVCVAAYTGILLGFLFGIWRSYRFCSSCQPFQRDSLLWFSSHARSPKRSLPRSGLSGKQR